MMLVMSVDSAWSAPSPGHRGRPGWGRSLSRAWLFGEHKYHSSHSTSPPSRPSPAIAREGDVVPNLFLHGQPMQAVQHVRSAPSPGNRGRLGWGRCLNRARYLNASENKYYSSHSTSPPFRPSPAIAREGDVVPNLFLHGQPMQAVQHVRSAPSPGHRGRLGWGRCLKSVQCMNTHAFCLSCNKTKT
jgi:hypothetical protein